MIDLETLREAKELCQDNEAAGKAIFRNRLGDFRAQTYLELVSWRERIDIPDDIKRLQRVAHAMEYLGVRLDDFFVRLELMELLWDYFNQDGRRDSLAFYSQAGLLIKDFHIDVGAIMDAIAPIVIGTNQVLKQKDARDLPGFADIRKGAKRSFRDKIPNNLLLLVDDTERWWPRIKVIRDVVSHRSHQKLVFGRPGDPKMFQVYDEKMDPQMLEPAFLLPSNATVVRFEVYAAFIWAEINVFLDKLGALVADQLGRQITGGSGRISGRRYLVTELNNLVNAQH
jgi:hypothetical protein